jgi:hypothetical protein
MTKQEMIASLRMVAANENTIGAMSNAYELGEENERDIICTLIFSIIEDHALANKLVDTIRVRQ